MAALKRIHDPLETVWPAIAEAMHLLAGASRGPDALCDMVADAYLTLVALDATDFPRLKELLRKYRDLPMEFADAALVRAAKQQRVTRILTFGAHFHVYRLPHRVRFTVLPASRAVARPAGGIPQLRASPSRRR